MAIVNLGPRGGIKYIHHTLIKASASNDDLCV